jgi:very-short-patch-repair endonuclease
MASLQAALKQAIQTCYQLEDNELAAEPLPDRDARHTILFYEASEGGAGVLRQIISDQKSLPDIIRAALELCHFDPDTGEDRRRAFGAVEDCEAACYDCMMSYGNQRDHSLLDRQAIHELLMKLKGARVSASPVGLPRAEHLKRLMNQAGSELEREWLRFLDDRDLHLPTKAQVFMESCKTRPDFTYEDAYTLVYVDGPVHDFSDRQERDLAQSDCLEDLGYSVIRFSHQDDWEKVVATFPNVFGLKKG